MTLMAKLTTSAGLLALATGFAAAAPAVVQNDLNLRAGPGPNHEVIAAMPAGTTVNVIGCEASWCRVAFGNTMGFASRGFLGLAGPIATRPAYGYGESYAYGGYAPRRDEGGYAYGGYSPGYTHGYSEGARTFGNERRFSEESSARRERMNRNTRAAESSAANPMLNAKNEAAVGNRRARGERAAQIQGANPMINAPNEPAAGANANARAEVRSSANPRRGLRDDANARATTGGRNEDHGPNFIGPGKKNIDNH